jgi:hypothetical protein
MENRNRLGASLLIPYKVMTYNHDSEPNDFSQKSMDENQRTYLDYNLPWGSYNQQFILTFTHDTPSSRKILSIYSSSKHAFPFLYNVLLQNSRSPAFAQYLNITFGNFSVRI